MERSGLNVCRREGRHEHRDREKSAYEGHDSRFYPSWGNPPTAGPGPSCTPCRYSAELRYMRKGSGLVSSALVGALTLSACVADRSVEVGGTQERPSTTAGSPDGSPAVDERISDLSYLIERAESIHPRLYHGVARHRIQRTLGRIEARLHRLDRYDFMVEVMRLLALFGAQGGEAHTGLFPFEQSIPLSFLPVRLYLFPKGVFVVQGRKGLDRFVGSELTHIDGVPVDRIVERVTPLIARDNRHSLRARVPWLLAQMEVLRSLGITEGAAGATLRLRAPSGATVDEAVRAIPSEVFQEWAGVWHEMIPAGLPKDERVLTLARTDRDIWLEYLPEPNLIFLQYNVTLPDTSGVARRLRKLAREQDRKSVV